MKWSQQTERYVVQRAVRSTAKEDMKCAAWSFCAALVFAGVFTALDRLF